MPALQKDLTASGKAWEDPGWQAGMWTLISAPLLSREVQALVLGLKGLQLLLGLRVTTWPQAGLSLRLPPLSEPRAHRPLGTRTKSSWNWEEATIPSILGWPQGSGGARE